MMRRHSAVLAVSAVALVLAPLSIRAGERQPASAEGGPVVVLDTCGFWRIHQSLKPPVIQFADGLKPILIGPRWLAWDTPGPPPGWTQPDFDDSGWLRGTARRFARVAYTARLCLRGKFTITDPSAVKGLLLSVGYHGGVAVYVNGKDVTRQYLSAGDLSDAVLAEAYPEAAFLTKEGELVNWQHWRNRPEAEKNLLREIRLRKLDGVPIPQGLLRKGVNVLAVEIIRAPYDKVLEEKMGADETGKRGYECQWNTCELRYLQLTATGPDGLVPNAVRPPGLQAWNSDALAGDFDLDFGDPDEPLRPIRLVGARNGIYSGKVVLGSADPIRGLKAQASDLRGGAGTIPASAVRTRYGFPWGEETLYDPYMGLQRPSPYPAQATLLAGLSDVPLGEYPVLEKKPGSADLATPNQPKPVFGAVTTAWVTVRVPSDAKPGAYSGQVTVHVQDQGEVTVPVELEVMDWTLPAPEDFRTWIELIQSPDTLAVEYGVPLWSDRHFELIARSFDLLREVGSRTVYVPLIAHTNFGNEQSMVRWIEKGDGTFDYDFSVMDRYLDVAEKHMGKPKIVVFNVWDVYIVPKDYDTSGKGAMATAVKYLKEKGALLGKGPCVTLLDGQSNTTQNIYLPFYTEGPSHAYWQPLLSQLRERMQERGLGEAVMLGCMTDSVPSKEEVAFFAEIAPGVPWVSHAHGGPSAGRLIYDLAPIGYQTRVWNVAFADGDPAGKLRCGWKKPFLLADYERHREINDFPATKWRHEAEVNITGEQRGIGRVGGDHWNAIKDARGQRKGTVSARYPESSWRNLDLFSCLLAPGPDGPCATNRFEAFREGVQECEGRIVIERALTDKDLRERIGPDLAKRCEDALDERALYMWTGLSELQLTGASYARALAWRARPSVAGHLWFIGSGWQERSRKLYALAGEVTARLGE
jgi:hypothetical protein